jgi:antitoxin (DNA-binding transcriptional repressor) of toxin-antitoxin stability system
MSVLTKPPCSTYLLNMQSISSRDLVHRSKEIRKLLSAGQTLRWTSHGVPVALIQPATAQVPLAKPDWISRARAAGAVNSRHPSIADTVYEDRS